MPTKVLVFESDAAFAGELRSELGKLGCVSQIVDDGNVGLQQAAAEKPDLILLSIELPRMNGFSVCNKLKKDASLKDVPLIIMSSESSEETFEQHRKLRTRAEDYVHKPIAFGELLQHIQTFVRIEAPARGPSPSEGAILIDDDIGQGVELDEEDEGTQIAHRPPEFQKQKPREAIDAEVDAFADAAFGRLTGESVVPPPPAPPPAEEATMIRKPTSTGSHPRAGNDVAAHAGPPSAPSLPSRSVEPAQAKAKASSPPPLPPQAPQAPRPSGADQGEVERLKAELERSKARATELERDLGGAKAEVARMQQDMQRGSKSDAESQKMQREIDELRAKLATGTKASGGASSRELLDMREGLNKKDKEILTLKEALSRKDRDIVEEKDRVLVLERTKSDLDDKILDTERELADAKDKIDVLAADKEQAKKAGEDFKNRLTRAQAEIEARGKEMEELRARQAEELTARDAREAALKGEHATALQGAADDKAQALALAAAEMARALEQAEGTRQADLEAAARAQEAALADARDVAANEKAAAVAKREAEVRAEAADKLALELAAADSRLRNELGAAEALRASQLEALRRESEEMLAAAQKDRDDKIAALTAESEDRVETLERDRDERLATAARERADAIETLERDRDDRIRRLESDRDARLAALTDDRDTRIAALERERDEKITALEQDRDTRIAALTEDRDTRISALESKSARELADARAVAEAQKGDADQRISELETDLLTVRGELADLKDEKRDLDAKNAQEIADLTEKVRQMTETKEGLERELSRARDRIAALEVEGSGLRGDLDDTRRKLSDETRRADHAFAKWESDKGSLERAKDALAVALSQIEDAEARTITAP